MKNLIAVLAATVAALAIILSAPAPAVTTNTLSATAFASITIPAAYSNATELYFAQPTGATAVWVTAKSVAGSILIMPTSKSAGLTIGAEATGGTNYSLTPWVTISATSTYSFVCPEGHFPVKNTSGAAQVIDIGF